MKKILFITCMILCLQHLMAQDFPLKRYSVGIQGGGAAIAFLEPWGFNYQINVERNYRTGISLGASIGSFQFNDFPDFWESDGFVNEVNGIPPEVFDYIQNNYTPLQAVFTIGYSAYRVNYYQTYIAYTIPIEVLRTRVRFKGGLSYLHWTYHRFAVAGASPDEVGRIESITPFFEVGSAGLLGWNLGGGLEQGLTPDFDLIADFSYQLPLNNGVQNLDGFVTILVGVRYRFGEE